MGNLSIGVSDNEAREPLEIRARYITVVLISALIVAFESVAIEASLNISDINIFLVSAMPSIVGGLILMGISPKNTVEFSRGLGRRGWLGMLVLCVLAAIGVLLWFDSIGRIGAGKEALLGGGSSEVLFVVILSALFLHERLGKWEAVGGSMIVVGVFLVLADVGHVTLEFGLGEAEAIIGSLCLGAAVVMTTSLLKNHALTPLSGVELLLSGLIVLSVGFLTGIIEFPGTIGWIILLLLGLFPAAGLLTYNAGLPKIGASLTSVLFALNGIMTVGVQLLILFVVPDAEIMLPRSVVLAMLGGGIAFAGVYILQRNPAAPAKIVRI
jgi:drug/metabolite transporter (DMT)-like permease